MRTIILFFSLTTIFSGCISESEQQGIHEIRDFFGCDVSYKKGISKATGESSKKTFQVELSGGELINQISPELISSKAALLLFNSFDSNEKDNYSHIKCVVKQKLNNTSKTTEMEYAVNDVRVLNEKQFIYFDCATYLTNREYELLYGRFAPQTIEDLDKEKFFNHLDNLSEVHGYVFNNQVHGFTMYESESNGDTYNFIEIHGILEREKNSTDLIITVSADELDDKLYGLQM